MNRGAEDSISGPAASTVPDPRQLPRRYPLLRFAVLVAGVAGLALAVLAAGAPAPGSWADLVAGAGAWAAALAVAGTAVLAVALVPRAVLAAAGGLLFGPLVGAAVVLAGAGGGAVVAFAVGRWLGQDFVLAHRRAAVIDQWLVHQGLLGVIVARLLPVAPFGLVSYGYGLSRVPVSVFWLGTLVGAAPSTVVYANLGAAALSPGTPGFVISLLAAVALAAAGVTVSHRLHRRRCAP